MDNWNEIRTAATVCRLGTITAAATELGVHRATVTRHIDSLEDELGAKLFQRHARGFTPTELGSELLRIAEHTQARFGELRRLSRGIQAPLTGEIVVTCLDVLVPQLVPLFVALRNAHPKLTVRLVSSDQKLKLEYGEADMAFRIGPKPNHPDNVVVRVLQLQTGLFASRDYITSHGRPDTIEELPNHRLISIDSNGPRTPYLDWIDTTVPADAIVLRTNSILAMWECVRAGIGIGFHPSEAAHQADLVPLFGRRPEWNESVWAVTHVDLHKTPKVQALVRAIRSTSIPE